VRSVEAISRAIAIERHEDGIHVLGIHSPFRSRAQMRGSYLHGH
jgi:hypothetical protein